MANNDSEPEPLRVSSSLYMKQLNNEPVKRRRIGERDASAHMAMVADGQSAPESIQEMIEMFPNLGALCQSCRTNEFNKLQMLNRRQKEKIPSHIRIGMLPCARFLRDGVKCKDV